MLKIVIPSSLKGVEVNHILGFELTIIRRKNSLVIRQCNTKPLIDFPGETPQSIRHGPLQFGCIRQDHCPLFRIGFWDLFHEFWFLNQFLRAKIFLKSFVAETDKFIVNCNDRPLTKFVDTFGSAVLQDFPGEFQRNITVAMKPASQSQFGQDVQSSTEIPGEGTAGCFCFAVFPGIPLFQPLVVKSGPSGGKLMRIAEDFHDHPQQHGIGCQHRSAGHGIQPVQQFLRGGFVVQIPYQILFLMFLIHRFDCEHRQTQFLQSLGGPGRDHPGKIGMGLEEIADIEQSGILVHVGTFVESVNHQPEPVLPDQDRPLLGRKPG